jgi:DNA-binding NarL/FixJ family response regulator
VETPELSDRHKAIMQMVADGKTPGEIASTLQITTATLRRIKKGIHAKLNVYSDKSALSRCWEMGWIQR